MLLFKQLQNTKLISTDAVDFGVIQGFCGNENKIALFVTERGTFGVGEIVSVGDVVVAKSVFESNAIDCDVLQGKAFYYSSGKLKGTLADVSVANNLTVKKFVLDNGTVLPQRIDAFGDVVVLKKPTRRPKKLCRELNVQKTATVRKSGDFSFLIGRTCDKVIENFQGEVMIRRGDVVTKENVAEAKRSGKLVELSLHTK